MYRLNKVEVNKKVFEGKKSVLSKNRDIDLTN
jgi:hypothetical protein